MKIISKGEAAKMINETNGKVFTCHFIKRSTGDLRIINCRTGVKKHLKGGELPFDPREKKLRTVFDMQNKGYRMISLDAVVKLIVDHVEYEVK
jgi:hypothetical protein